MIEKSNKRSGYIEEKIYDPPYNVDETIAYLGRLSDAELVKRTPEITSGYPNTYTFSKFLVEHKMRKERGNLPLAIVRPTTIGAAFREPLPGWVDTITSLTGVYFFIGLGLTKEIQADKNTILDIVAVDLCANMVIAAGAYQAGRNSLEIFHSASSSRNPVSQHTILQSMIRYIRAHRPKALEGREPSVRFYPNEIVYKLVFWAKRRLPAVLYELFAKLTLNEVLKEKVGIYKKALTKSTMLVDTFKYFATHTWIFDTTNTDKLNLYFTSADLTEFQFDMGVVDWERYNTYYVYGLWTYLAKEKLDPPDSPVYEDLFHTKDYKQYSHKPFGELRYILSLGEHLDPKSTDLRMLRVLDVEEVKRAMRKYVESRKREIAARGRPPVNEDRLLQEAYDRAQRCARRMECKIQKWVALGFAFFAKQYLQRIFKKISIDPADIARLKSMKDAAKGPIVIIPNHRSYMDFMIVTLSVLLYGLETPYVAAAEDFLKIPIVSGLFRSAGAFFIQRGQKTDSIYRAVVREYVKHLLIEGNSLEFYIEGKRTRSGKLLKPKLGMLKMVLETYWEKRVPEVQIVPVSISYERILEGESFIQEFMGEGKKQETLGRVIAGFTTLFESYGTVHISFGEPLKLSTFVSPYSAAAKGKCLVDLGARIMHDISANMFVMSTEVVASLVLSKKRLALSELLNEFDMVRGDLIARNRKIVYCSPPNKSGRDSPRSRARNP